MIISKKRIQSLNFLDKFDLDNIQIGIQVTNDEYKKLGLTEFVEGTAIQPSPTIGINCNRNSNGYSYPDKTRPKEYRIVNTIEWTLRDWGGYEHSGYADIGRYVYPKIEIEAANIELVLTKNKKGEYFIVANMNKNEKKEFLKQTINMLLEVFGFCEIFTKDLDLLDTHNKIKRCNWELLPPGIKATVIANSNKTHKNSQRKDFNQFRLDTLSSYNPLEIFVGTGGFTGYYAYIFENTCYLENGTYGNATYVIPKDKWKELSQLSKKELLSTQFIISKINHTSTWEQKIKELMYQTEKIKL